MKRSCSDGQRGSTLVEFVLVGPLFLFLLIVSVDMLRITYNYLTIQYIAGRVMREVSIGPASRPGSYCTQAEWIQGDLVQLATQLHVPLQTADIRICSFATLVSAPACVALGTCADPCTSADAERSGEIIAVEVQIPAREGFFWHDNILLGKKIYPIPPALIVTRNERWADLPTPASTCS